MKILVIEDDIETGQHLQQTLAAEGHDISLIADGMTGRDQAISASWDLLIVDRMLPGLDGLALIRTAREAGQTCPILCLTTLSALDDRVAGLDAGADDYLGKPFALSELVARVTALGRRGQWAQPETTLRVADLEVDLIARTVLRAGKPISLQQREFQLLVYLMRHEGQIVTRGMLLQHVWNFHFDPQTNLVESHISRLRAKIDRGHAELIHTVRGAGYSLYASA